MGSGEKARPRPLAWGMSSVEDVSVPPHTEGVCGGGCVSSPSHGGGMGWRMCQFPLTQRGYVVEDVSAHWTRRGYAVEDVSVPPHTEGVCSGGCVSSPSHGGGMRWRMCQFPLTWRGYAVEDVSVPPHTEGVCGGGCVSSPSHRGGMRWRMCQFPLTQRGYAVEDVSVPPHMEGVWGGGCVSSPSHGGGMWWRMCQFPSHRGGMRWRMCQFPLTQRGYVVEDVSVPPHTEGVCGGGCVGSPSHGGGMWWRMCQFPSHRGGMRWRMCQFPLTQRGYVVEDVSVPPHTEGGGSGGDPENGTASSSFWE